MAVPVQGVWSELHRPQAIGDVLHQDVVKNLLEGAIVSGELPNLLFYGPPGTGKTSLALAFAKRIFGSDWRTRTLELNASDDRGIDVIRDRVKSWARLVFSGKYGSYKLIILDEVDSMTPDAQNALRRIMEDCVKNTRFILICNYDTKIREAIRSRCVRCRFNPIPRAAQIARLSAIAEKAVASGAVEVRIATGALEAILDAARGDLRFAINLLQTAAATAPVGLSSSTKPTAPTDHPLVVDRDRILALLGRPEEELVGACLQFMFAPEPRDEKKTLSDLAQLTAALMTSAVDIDALLEQFVERILMNDNVSEKRKAQAVNIIALASARLTSGASELAQLIMVLTNVAVLKD